MVSHVKNYHPNYEFALKDSTSNAQKKLYLTGLVSKRAFDIFESIQWICMRNLPFTFFDDHYTKNNINFDATSYKTVIIFMDLINEKVENKIRLIMLDNFGLILDG